jgi:hypothetical protein
MDVEIQTRIQKIEDFKAKHPSLLRKKLDELEKNKDIHR